MEWRPLLDIRSSNYHMHVGFPVLPPSMSLGNLDRPYEKIDRTCLELAIPKDSHRIVKMILERGGKQAIIEDKHILMAKEFESWKCLKELLANRKTSRRFVKQMIWADWKELENALVKVESSIDYELVRSLKSFIDEQVRPF